MIRRLRDRLADDSGITLPEVIVVALLAVLVLGAVGGAYIGSIGVQKLVPVHGRDSRKPGEPRELLFGNEERHAADHGMEPVSDARARNRAATC